MKTHLLKSFIFVTSFWWGLAFLSWMFSDAESALAVIKRISQINPFIEVPELSAESEMLETLAMKAKVISWWTIPCLLIAAIAGIVGYFFTWKRALSDEGTRKEREQGNGNFRGMTLTLGELPRPIPQPLSPIELEVDDSENNPLSRLTQPELRLLEDVLGILAANPAAYPGPGVLDTLPEHALSVVEKALNNRHFPGMCAIAAAAHEMGKINAFKKNEDTGEWEQVKNQEKEAVKILCKLETWWALPRPDRLSVYLAVKYKQTPKLMPILAGDKKVVDVAWDLLNTAIAADSEVKEIEKQKVIEKHENNMPEILWNTFVTLLPSVSFHSRNAPVGVPKIGHKSGKRIYLIEIKLRDVFQAKLPEELKSVFPSGPWKVKGKAHPLSVEFMKMMDSKGILVTEINGESVAPHEALWKLKAGEVEFKGVIALDCTPELLQYCPTEDSSYNLEITGALFKAKEDATSMIKDAMGDILGPKKQ